MNCINSLIIEGNLLKNPEIKVMPSGTPLCVFSIANNRFYRKDGRIQRDTSYFDVETWAELANHCARIAKQGTPVRIVGRIKQYRWSSSSGQNCSSIRIVAEHVEFKSKAEIETEIDDRVEEPNVLEEEISELTYSANHAVF